MLEDLSRRWEDLANRATNGKFAEVSAGFEKTIIARQPPTPSAKDENAKVRIGLIKKLFRDAAPAPSNEKLGELVGISIKQQGPWLKETEPFGQTILELAQRLQTRYGEAKQQENRLDFADLERKCLELLNAGKGEQLQIVNIPT